MSEKNTQVQEEIVGSGTVLQDEVLGKKEACDCDTAEPKLSEPEIALKVKKLTTKVQIALGMLESFEYALLPGNPEDEAKPFLQAKASTYRNEERDVIAEQMYKDYNELMDLLSL